MNARMPINTTKELLKHFVSCLHSGETTDAIKLQFSQVLRHTSPLELAHLESQLMTESVPRDALLKLYGLQVDLFREIAIH